MSQSALSQLARAAITKSYLKDLKVEVKSRRRSKLLRKKVLKELKNTTPAVKPVKTRVKSKKALKLAQERTEAKEKAKAVKKLAAEQARAEKKALKELAKAKAKAAKKLAAEQPKTDAQIKEECSKKLMKNFSRWCRKNEIELSDGLNMLSDRVEVVISTM